MKKIFNFISSIGLMTLILTLTPSIINAQNCDITKTNGGGFTTTIQSVVDNCNSTYTIVLLVEHNGCSGSTCQELSHYSVQATPGTYSNVSVAVITGGMTYSNIDLGPNLGSDPFSGFKVDNTYGIGDGMAGSFTVTYTLSGNLQNQQTSAKAGQNAQIASFTSADFDYVMNCNNTNCNPIADCDGDGIPDGVDEYPCDPTRTYNITTVGTLAFEDLWPSKGDFDFNDVVVKYRTTLVTNTQNMVVDVRSSYKITAVGASYRNGFGIQFDNVLPNQVASVTGYSLQKGYITLNSNGTEASQSKAVVIVFDDTENTLHRAGGPFFNTVQNGLVGTTDSLYIDIHFTTPLTPSVVGTAPFNPFIIRNGDREIEIHLPDRVPTSLVNTSYFGTSNDKTNPSTGYYYKTQNGLPWAIHIPTVLDHMIEKTPINLGYLHFIEWAQSNGTSYPDWYLNLSGYRDASKIWTP